MGPFRNFMGVMKNGREGGDFRFWKGMDGWVR